MIHGDDEFGSSDLIGRNSGYDKRKLIDNYVRNVLKTEESMKVTWADNRLTQACRDGHTLIYDEFTRSRPEANNALLSILEEKFLNLPKSSGQGSCFLEVHPDFRAIFTSNPEEYAGVHKTQDALMDRLITVNLGHFDRETEVRIAMAKSGISRGDAETIVEVVRRLRDVGVTNYGPTIRACIAIARIVANAGARAQARDPVFRWVVRDVLCTETPKVTRDGKSVMGEKVEEVIRKVCGSGAAPRVRKVQGKKELKKDQGGEICRSPVEV
jgi:gas vesicle protein GvpN